MEMLVSVTDQSALTLITMVSTTTTTRVVYAGDGTE